MAGAGHAARPTNALRWRAGMDLVPALLLVLAATLLALPPPPLNGLPALVLGIITVFFLPGYLLEKIVNPSASELSLTRLAPFFVYSLVVWAIPATALQLAGANWLTFHIVFIVVMWGLLLAAVARLFRAQPAAHESANTERTVEWGLAALCVGVALLVAVGPRDADDWMYLQITQQFLGSDSFRILEASEARYSIRYAFHVWIFLQAFLGEWLGVDLVTLLRDQLPVLLAPLALVSLYSWARTFFGRAHPALLAVVIQLLIYGTFAYGDGWGRGFFARSAQDKFLVWLIVLPVALAFAWKFLQGGRFADWFGYGAALIAGLWVHPVSEFLVVLTLGGLALFNWLGRAPLPRARWLWIGVASLPALLAPLVIRATTLPAVFTVDTPEVIAYVRLSEGRLLFQPPFYIADPALVAHPLILVSLVLLVALGARQLRQDLRTQYLWGATLVPLALLFDPLTARLLGEMLTPWQLWRLTWNLPAAFILTDAVLRFLPQLRAPNLARRERLWGAAALAGGIVLMLALSSVNYGRSFGAFTKDHALNPQVEDMLRTLTRTLTQPARVLLPRDITRYASAYTYRAQVMSNDAQKEEDARGKQIDRFYDPAADPKFLEAFLNFWEIEYAIVPNSSLADRFLSRRAKTQKLYTNDVLTLYKTETQKPPE